MSLALFGLALLQGATSCALVRIDAGEQIGPVEAYRLTLSKGRALFGSVSMAVISGLALAATGFLIPVAAWLAVRWSFLAQTIMLEDTPALGRSGEAAGSSTTAGSGLPSSSESEPCSRFSQAPSSVRS